MARKNLKGLIRDAEGATAAFTAICMVALIGMASLAIDIGQLYTVRNELQNAADAAALAGVGNLIKSQDGVAVRDGAAALQAAMRVAQRQSQLQALPVVSDGDRNDLTILLGEWNVYAGSPVTAWTEDGTTCSPYSNANAVRVTIRRAKGSVYGPVTNFLAVIFGDQYKTSEVVATATAYLGFVKSTHPGAIPIPLAVPDTILTAANRSGAAWWASLLAPSEACAEAPKQITFKDLGSGTFYMGNQNQPLFDTNKAYLFVVNPADSVPGTVLDNLKKNYAAGKAIRAMERGTRLYPISEYQWATYLKSIFKEFKHAYDAKKDAQGRWKVCVPLYSTDTSLAENFLKGVMKVARMISFGVPQAHACFTFWNKTYPGGNVPIYVKGFANVDIVNVQYNSSCDTCSTYAPATDGKCYVSGVDCMIKNELSCRNVNSVTIEVPLDAATVSPPGTESGGPSFKDINSGVSNEQAGALAAIPRLVK